MISKSEKETIDIGKKIAKKLKGGDVILFYGDLGTGKTQLVKGIACELGIKEKITSPTFVFVKELKIPKQEFSKLYHVDLYRIRKETEAFSLGISEAFEDKNGVVLIEWAEKLMGVPKEAIIVKLEYRDDNEREIKIKNLEI